MSNLLVTAIVLAWALTGIGIFFARQERRRYQRSEAKLRALLSSIDDLILVLDREGTYLEIVPTNPSLLYRPAAEVIGRRIREVFPKSDADKFLAAIEESLNEQKTVSVDYSLPIGNRTLWFSGSIAPVNNTSVIWVARDITERKVAEEALEQRVKERTQEISRTLEALNASEERFRILASATSDAVYDIDLATGFVWRGSSYENLFGYAQGRLEPNVAAWRQFVHPDDSQRIELSYREALETGATSLSLEYRFRREDGSYADILDNARILRESGKAVRVVGAMVDITERRQLERQLEQAKRVTSLGRVAASIAHEINNVLMGIQPNAEVMLRKSPDDLRHVAENIIQAVSRGKRVTDEILRYTRPGEPTLQCVQVSTFLQKWAEETRPLLGSNVHLSLSVDNIDICVLADAMQISQVFTNLALNARDAMQERGGTLRLHAEVAKSWGAFRFGVVKSPDRFVHISVDDEGCGITDLQLAHIFEPLYTTKKSGVGLGLAIAYQVILRHGGQIFVESEVGRGSTFHVFLPLTLPAFHEAEKTAMAELGFGKVLLVEDEPMVAAGIAMLLQMEGIEVETVAAGTMAIAAIERFLPDAVVLDIGLPDIDGVTVYLQIHSRWPGLPVLFSSGHGDSAQLEAYLSRPNVGFIPKPYDFDTVRRALAAIVPSQRVH